MTDTVKKMLDAASLEAEFLHLAKEFKHTPVEEMFQAATGVLGDHFLDAVERHATALRATGHEELQDKNRNASALLHIFITSMLSSVLFTMPSADRAMLVEDIQDRIK